MYIIVTQYMYMYAGLSLSFTCSPPLHAADLKKTMAVLLDSILERLGKLEKKVDHAISNGTQNLLRNISSGLHQDGVSMEHKDGEGGGGDGMDSKEAVNKAKGQ